MEVFNFERDQKAIENLHEILFGNYNVVVITGAGISTLSGTSDFRGINGLYARNPENIKKFYREYLENDPKGFYDFYTSQMMHEGIKPNIVHEVLAKLEERGLIKDYSNREAVEKLLNTKQTIYCGFDPTNKSLHIGNFLTNHSRNLHIVF